MRHINWGDKRIVIAQHQGEESGPGQVLIDYFKERNVPIIYHIAHPNLYFKKGFTQSSRIIYYRNGKLQSKKVAPYFHLYEFLLYIKDVFFTIFWLLKESKVDLFIGLGNLNAFSGYILKKLGKVKTVVYYVIDYIPTRFENIILNNLYHVIERQAALVSDWTWNLSQRIIDTRQQRWNRKFTHQLVVPHGLFFDERKVLSYNKINRYELIYMGYLNEEQGVDFVIETFPQILRNAPFATFTIIGTGNYERELKQMVQNFDLSNHITFLGQIPDRRDMEKRLAKGAVAIALYKPTHGFSFYSDPGKIKHYLSVGLPIIMTHLPPIAHIVKERECGIVIPYDKQRLTKAVVMLMTDDKYHQKLRRNSIELAKEYQWEKILFKPLKYIFDT